MIEFISAHLSRIIAFMTIFEFEFVLIYRRRYLLNDNKVNTVVMVLSCLVFIDAFIYTVMTYSNPQTGSIPGYIRLGVHTAAIVFFLVFYLVKNKAE